MCITSLVLFSLLSPGSRLGVSIFHSRRSELYTDANGKKRGIGLFDTQEQAAHAVNAAIRRAGLEGRRNTNPVVDGQLVPRGWGGRSAVVAPDPARAPTAPTSEFWGVRWDKSERRWRASYSDANGKWRFIGLFDTQEAAAHAVNAAIRALPPDVQVLRNTNPVVDGQLVPKSSRKRSRAEEPAAAP